MRIFRTKRPKIFTLSAACVLLGVTISAIPATAETEPFIEGELFVNSESPAAAWAADNPNDQRSGVIAEEIGSQPGAHWVETDTQNVKSNVAGYVEKAEENDSIPMLVAYNIPNRDCGQHSSGGVQGYDEYQEWVEKFTEGIGDVPAIVLLEPDSLALDTCLDSQRSEALAKAVETIKGECSGCKVYLDAGNSAWQPAGVMAERLEDAGVLEADGFFSNVSNYNFTESEESFGLDVLNELGNPSGIGQVIDTSRNGNGPTHDHAWCDPSGRAIGASPTLDTNNSNIHALLWVKEVGEADGCIANAGDFVPQAAYDLATN